MRLTDQRLDLRASEELRSVADNLVQTVAATAFASGALFYLLYATVEQPMGTIWLVALNCVGIVRLERAVAVAVACAGRSAKSCPDAHADGLRPGQRHDLGCQRLGAWRADAVSLAGRGHIRVPGDCDGRRLRHGRFPADSVFDFHSAGARAVPVRHHSRRTLLSRGWGDGAGLRHHPGAHDLHPQRSVPPPDPGA